MHDLVIRNGTVIDGTGKPSFEADVAINGERITGVGDVSDAAYRVIDATGKLVTPGFVDTHTHMDAQFIKSSATKPRLSRRGCSSGPLGCVKKKT